MTIKLKKHRKSSHAMHFTAGSEGAHLPATWAIEKDGEVVAVLLKTGMWNAWTPDLKNTILKRSFTTRKEAFDSAVETLSATTTNV